MQQAGNRGKWSFRPETIPYGIAPWKCYTNGERPLELDVKGFPSATTIIPCTGNRISGRVDKAQRGPSALNIRDQWYRGRDAKVNVHSRQRHPYP